MATALGAGSALASAWFLDPMPTAALHREPHRAPLPVPERGEGGDAEESGLLSRISSTLACSTTGLTLSELRLALSESAEALQTALAAGLRTRRLRRLGSHNRLRYLLNF
jgi:hypothetical protein